MAILIDPKHRSGNKRRKIFINIEIKQCQIIYTPKEIRKTALQKKKLELYIFYASFCSTPFGLLSKGK